MIQNFSFPAGRKLPAGLTQRVGTAFWLMVLALVLVRPAGPAGADARPNTVSLGEVKVILAGPEGLARVDGLKAQADAYVQKTAPKLKFQVLALYAETGEWSSFVAAAAEGRPAAMPRFALLGTTKSMAGKHYDPERLRREFARYDKWFSLAAGNRPLAALLTRQGNRKLTEVMGVDIGFEFKVDQFTRKFHQSSDSLSVGARVNFNVFGQPSRVFLTVTSLAVGDKIIFLAYFEKDGQENQGILDRARAWRLNMARLNAGQYKPGLPS